eukprot:SAG25_NODE_10292_length_339_cov_1.066667_1_plen_24_part_10
MMGQSCVSCPTSSRVFAISDDPLC